MGTSITTLYDGSLLCVREFRLPLDDKAWRVPNDIESSGPIVVFPRWAVLIEPFDERPVLATPNIAMLYRPGDVYHRHARDPRGDECLFIRVYGRELPGGTHAPTDPATYLRQHLLGRYLRAGDVDPLLAETTAAELVDRVVGGGRLVPTSASHRRLAAAAEELIAATVRESPSLHELATELNVSPFHLARVFRRVTGFGLHEYRRQLRLRLALRSLERGGLTELAFELGFSSHSHFTDAFRREFGLTPSQVTRRDAAELLAA
jgi:AraC-like DNA-binding protein